MGTTTRNWGDSDVVARRAHLRAGRAFRITPSLYYQHLYSHDSSGFEPAESPQSADPFVQQWGSLNPKYSNINDGRFVYPQLEHTPSTDTFYLPPAGATRPRRPAAHLQYRLSVSH